MKTSMLGGTQRRALVARWPEAVSKGVAEEGGSALSPGDLVRLPAHVRWAGDGEWDVPGTVTGYAVGKDGTPCVVVDAVGEDVPELTRWRTWVVRGAECLVIDLKEAWRLETMYDRSGRLKPRGRVTRGKGK